jgi:hypothetical protein
VSTCCDDLSQCCDPNITNTPGATGATGAAGADGVDGVSAFALVANQSPGAQPTMPAAGADRDVEYASDVTAFAVGQIVYQQNWGWMRVMALVDNITLTLRNLETATEYTENAAAGTSLAAASRLVPGGLQGPAGTDGTSGAPVAATYITQVPNGSLTNEQAMSTLGTGLVKNTTVTGVQSIAIDGTDYLSPVTGVETGDIGTTVQAFDAFLTSLATLGTAADRMLYTTGVNTAAETAINSVGRAFIGQTTLQLMNKFLGGQIPRYGRFCMLVNVNVNSIADTALLVDEYCSNARYRIDKIMLENASISLTTAQVGVFTAAGGLGTPIAAAQVVSGLTAANKWIALTLEAVVGTDVFTASPLYFRVTTAQGAAATVNVHLFGWSFDAT